MKKIFYVIDSLAIGGAQRQLLELVRCLDKTRFEAAVCPLWPLMELEAEYRKAGVQIIKTHKHWHLDVSIWWRLAQQMKTFKPDIVHTWLFTGNLWGRLAAALARVPAVIASERGVVPKDLNRLDASFFNCLLAGLTDVVTTNSRAGQAKVNLPAGRRRPLVKVIYNGVDLRRFEVSSLPDWRRQMRESWGLGADSLILGTVGRLSPEKGHEVFLKAVRLVKEAGHQVTAVLVGGGPEQPKLEAQAAELGVSQCMRFLGSRPDIPQLLAGMDIFVLPSCREGLPNVILEAMAMARPVVATDVGGVSELVEHEVTGFLVEAGNPQLLAQAVLRLMDNPGLAAQMGAAGRQLVERQFSLERMVAETTALYDDLLRQTEIRP